MEINHALVPSKSELEAARFFARTTGVEVREIGRFALG